MPLQLTQQQREFLRTTSSAELLTMLAAVAVEHAKDMLSDMVGDSAMEFHGGVLPDKNDLIHHAHIMATEVNVQLGIDELLDDEVCAEVPRGESISLDQFMRFVIKQYIKDNPKSTELTIQMQ